MGGFIASHLASFSRLSAQVVSVAMISSFVNTTLFKTSGGFFSRFTGRSQLIDEIAESKLPPHLKPAARFVINQIENCPLPIINARIQCRTNSKPAPCPQLPNDHLLVVYCKDYGFQLNDSAKPQNAYQNATIVELDKGGNMPHLSTPVELFEALKNHLQKCHSPIQVEEEEEDSFDE